MFFKYLFLEVDFKEICDVFERAVIQMEQCE